MAVSQLMRTFNAAPVGGPRSAPTADPTASGPRGTVLQPTDSSGPALGTYPLPPGATWASPVPGYDPTGRPLTSSGTSSGSSGLSSDPLTMLGQLYAASLGAGGSGAGLASALQPQAVLQVPDQGAGSSSSSLIGVLVVLGLAFGVWYWYKHRKGA